MCIRDRFDNVPAGNFLVREIASPEAFVLTEEIFPVEITEDGQTKMCIRARIDDKVNAEGFERILGQFSGGVGKA